MPEPKKRIDLLITNARIWDRQATSADQTQYLAVSGGNILEIGSHAGSTQYFDAAKNWDAGGKWLLPGLINTHCHLFQVCMRGLGKDLPFMDWMNQSVRALMPKLDVESVYLAAMVGCMEAIRTGTTTLVDFMYANVKSGLADAVLRAFEDSGMRGILARGLTDVKRLPGSDQPSASYAKVEDSLADLERLRMQYTGHSRIGFALAPSVVWAMTSEGLRQAAQYARAQGLVLTMHLLETDDDDQYCMEKHDMRTTQLLEELGVLGPNFLAVHAVQATVEDFDRFARFGASISHNPVANMLLGAGVAPVCEFARRGIRVGLGTDGAASNDSQSMIEVMKTAALLQKVQRRDPAALSAGQVFAMATHEGAAAIGMEGLIGRLAPWMKADILVLNLDRPNTTPSRDPITSLVYSGGEGNVHSVFIDGKLVLEGGKFTGLDEQGLLARTRQEIKMIHGTAENYAGRI